MDRVCFLIDGFNVYHSVRDLETDIAAAKEAATTENAAFGVLASLPDSLHWLDLDGLCASYMGSIDPTVRGRTVYYFSALAHHAERNHPGVVARHQKFITALEATGVRSVLGSFKEKDSACPRFRQEGRHCRFSVAEECNGHFRRHEEKQTDVAIACKLMELATTDKECRAVVIVGGDSDLVPAIESAKRLRAELQVIAAFPYRRHSNEIRRVVDRSFTVRPEQYAKHQLPGVVTSLRGVQISKPESW